MNLWFRSFRVKLSRLEIIREIGKKVGEGFTVFSAKLKHRIPIARLRIATTSFARLSAQNGAAIAHGALVPYPLFKEELDL